MRCGDKKRKKITRVVFQLRKIIVLYLHFGMEGTLVSLLLCLVGGDAIFLASSSLLTIAVNFIIVFMFFCYILAFTSRYISLCNDLQELIAQRPYYSSLKILMCILFYSYEWCFAALWH